MNGETRVTVDAQEPAETDPTRFSVIFRLFPPADRVGQRYFVCTLLGERKALVMASAFYERNHPGEHIYDVIDVRSLGQGSPERNDLVDRMEW